MSQTIVSPGATGWGAKQWLLVAVALFGVLVVAGVVAAVTPFGLVGATALVGGVLFTLLGLLKLRKAFSVRSVEVEPAGSLGSGDGVVAVEGTARAAEETVTAPLTGEECVAYRVNVIRSTPTSSGGE
jgi:hypothetical protein